MSGYIGNIPTPQATQTRDTFTATAGQTTFATSGYTPSFLDVFMNGVHLVNGTDYTASNGSDVVLTSGAAAGDTLEVVAYSTFEVNSQTFTGTTTLTGDLQATTATFSGAVNGRDISADGTKLDGIEANATADGFFTNSGDIVSSNDLNDASYRNSVFYSLDPLNAGHTNNGVGFYLSTYGMGGTGNNATDERAGQLYFGDTPQSGLHYRVKQGSAGWHPWVGLSTGIRGVQYVSTDVHSFTTSQSGFTALEALWNRDSASDYAHSKFLIIVTANGAADDDASAVIEYYDGTNWTQPSELRGSGTGFSGSFGDFSVVRASTVENKQTVQYTASYLHAPNSTATTIGYRVRFTCENTAGFWLNRPMATDGGYNTNFGRSSLMVFEMTGYV